MPEELTAHATEKAPCGTVSTAYLRVVVEYGQLIGLSMTEQLEAVGVAPGVLDASMARVEAARYMALLDALERITGDETVGLQAGAHFQPRHYGEMGYVVLTATTVREAIVQGIRFEALACDVARTRLDESGPDASLSWHPMRGSLTRHAYELHTATWNNFASWLLGRRHSIRLVELPFAAPRDQSAHERIFGCPVRFEAARHAMHFPVELLSVRSLQADSHMQQRMLDLAEGQLKLHVQAAGSELEQARAFITANLSNGDPRITAVATHLRIPVRTLQRRLGERGLSFSTLVDGLRREIALRALGDPGISLAQLAAQLGFSEQSAFTHAFKRWTRLTPHAWRRRASPEDKSV